MNNYKSKKNPPYFKHTVQTILFDALQSPRRRATALDFIQHSQQNNNSSMMKVFDLFLLFRHYLHYHCEFNAFTWIIMRTKHKNLKWSLCVCVYFCNNLSYNYKVTWIEKKTEHLIERDTFQSLSFHFSALFLFWFLFAVGNLMCVLVFNCAN